MQKMNSRLTRRDALGYLLAYTCLILVALLSMWAILRIRSTVNFVWLMMSGSLLTLRAIDRLGIVFLCLICLAYIVFAEDLFQTSIGIARMERAEAEVRSSDQTEDSQESKGPGLLKRWGLGILARRFATTLVPPLVVLILTYVAERLSFLWVASLG